jgi:diguanylate cyclase (GGDEF)-like protein
MIVTGLFSALYLVIAVLLWKGKSRFFISYLVSLSMLALFTYFLQSGGVDGFSTIWICLLPSLGVFFFGMRGGVINSLIMLIIIILLLWTPIFNEFIYHYTNTFRIRFPIVFISNLMLAFVLEYIRNRTYHKMKSTMKIMDELVKTDQTTKLYNRRYFDEKLDELWDLMSMAKGELSLILIDIDFFKKYNDHYGHLAGDEALIAVANLIAMSVQKKNSTVARWGGEEFIVLLPLTDVKTAKLIAEDILNAVSKKSIPHEASELSEKYLTVSIGLATTIPSSGEKIADFVNQADHSLYSAKKNGRNRIGEFILNK